MPFIKLHSTKRNSYANTGSLPARRLSGSSARSDKVLVRFFFFRVSPSAVKLPRASARSGEGEGGGNYSGDDIGTPRKTLSSP